MKNKIMDNIKKNLCSMLLQGLALAGTFLAKEWSAGLLVLSILWTGIDTIGLLKKKAGVRICPKCGAEFTRKCRVCPNCGNVFEKADEEKEFAEVIEDQNEREPEETPEELERNFEKIEEISIERALAMGEDDIEKILTEKLEEDDNTLN